MAREVKDQQHPGLYDSDTGVSLKAEKIVDITEDCPKASNKNRALLLFTRAKGGRIVQITRPYEGEVYMGSHRHFFVDKLDVEMNMVSPDDTFGSTADSLGLTKSDLRSLIEAQAPA